MIYNFKDVCEKIDKLSHPLTRNIVDGFELVRIKVSLLMPEISNDFFGWVNESENVIYYQKNIYSVNSVDLKWEYEKLTIKEYLKIIDNFDKYKIICTYYVWD